MKLIDAQVICAALMEKQAVWQREANAAAEMISKRMSGREIDFTMKVGARYRGVIRNCFVDHHRLVFQVDTIDKRTGLDATIVVSPMQLIDPVESASSPVHTGDSGRVQVIDMQKFALDHL